MTANVRTKHQAILVGASIVLFWSAASSAQVAVTNLGLDGFTFSENDDAYAILVDESAEGADLNGDGDTFDTVAHLFDARSGTVSNLGLAVFGPPAADGNLLVLPVFELFQGNTDLNADGDTDDFVLHVVDTATGTVTNLMLAAFEAQVAGDRAAFSVFEFLQGNTDLNGDGDTSDEVVHVYSAGTASVVNLGLAGTSFAAPNFIAVEVGESQQGSDLNGDGDLGDSVLHVFNPLTAAVTNLAVASSGNFAASGDLLAFSVKESNQANTDLNLDGDINDAIAHVFDLASGRTENLALALIPFDSVRAAGGKLLYIVSESNQDGFDLNGDGDALDNVLHVFTLPLNVTNLELAVSAVGGSSRSGLVPLSVSETRQGGVDLNADGDLSDTVLHLFDTTTGLRRNLGLALSAPDDFQAAGDRIGFRVSEFSQGGTDFNGDTDASDSVFHVFDFGTETTVNLGLSATPAFEVRDRLMAFLVSELSQNSADLNGDGDASDEVVHVFDARTGVSQNLGLASRPQFLAVTDSIVGFSVPESSQGNADLNGDFDALDDVAHVAELDSDGDGVVDRIDNCVTVANPAQTDANSDGFGDACVSTGANIANDVVLGEGVIIESGARIGRGAVIDDGAVIQSDANIRRGAQIGPGATIESNATIDRDVSIGAGATVLANATVRRGAQVGAGATIESNATVDRGASIGDGAIVGANTRIRRDASIGDGVVIGPDATVNRGATIGAATVIGANTTIGRNVSIGQNTIIGSNVNVRRDAVIGDNVTIGDGLTIARGAVVPDGSVVL